MNERNLNPHCSQKLAARQLPRTVKQILKQTARARPDGVRLIQSSPPAACSFGQWLTLYIEDRNILLPSVDDMSSLLSQSSSVLNRRAFFHSCQQG